LLQTTNQIIMEEPSFGDKFRMFCEYDQNVYRNYKLGKMIKLFYDEKVKNDRMRHKKQLNEVVPKKTLHQRVKEELKDKTTLELFNQL
jgi:hypothetical protein